MFMTWRRGPRGQTSPDRAYGSVTRLAARLGFGPRPNQTVYEYAGALAEVLPEACSVRTACSPSAMPSVACVS